MGEFIQFLSELSNWTLKKEQTFYEHPFCCFCWAVPCGLLSYSPLTLGCTIRLPRRGSRQVTPVFFCNRQFSAGEGTLLKVGWLSLHTPAYSSCHHSNIPSASLCLFTDTDKVSLAMFPCLELLVTDDWLLVVWEEFHLPSFPLSLRLPRENPYMRLSVLRRALIVPPPKVNHLDCKGTDWAGVSRDLPLHQPRLKDKTIVSQFYNLSRGSFSIW